MKKLFKKSEVAIYAIAIMLVAAGYLNYTTMNKENSVETLAQEVSNNTTENTSIGDATLVNSNDVVKENLNENVIEDNDEDKEMEKVEEIVETNSEQNDYFTESKLTRDTNYASMLSNYTAILENDKISDTQKKIAMQEITNINNTKNAIMICENLLSTKGFTKNVVLVNDKSVNVVVQVENGLDTQKVSQIQNIVSRELKVELSDVHISEK